MNRVTNVLLAPYSLRIALNAAPPAATAVYAPLAKEFRILYRRTKSIHARLNG